MASKNNVELTDEAVAFDERINEWDQKKIKNLTREKEKLETDMYYIQEAQRMLVNPLYAKAFVMLLKTLPYYDEYEDDE